jgi:peptidoglycan/xylan/chitin deacetylase (PgdA/CDA1 family)
MFLKTAARAALHNMGGLAALRYANRRKFGILAFHSFSAANRANVEAMCAHVTAHFEPLSLSQIVTALQQGNELPDRAVAVTVDDGYRNYLEDGHPIFLRHKIPVTLFAVSGFAAGRLWLWPDQLEHKAAADLIEKLKLAPNEERLAFMASIDIPQTPPPHRAAMNWDELRAIAADGVEIGCHTESHPILTRLSSALELENEIKGAKESLEQNLGFPIRHFCYPNGKAPDFDDNVVAAVRAAGYESAVTCVWGLNATSADPLRLQRLPFDSSLDFHYAVELLAGLHL